MGRLEADAGDDGVLVSASCRAKSLPVPGPDERSTTVLTPFLHGNDGRPFGRKLLPAFVLDVMAGLAESF